ncbi:halocin C8-like domain-containing protein [Halorussus salilacus]|uniref:halocin C8-like domain-containing protein n=1 Tax=Halorussus salilacus TaxID=2953750 RepID=UPI00209F4A95|nr:halocin C8-like domain-containing protein [Halorussus salilacus]USZ67143.1 halocin C8-like domain-containing protein [Halorussus salilacus]
MAPDKPNRRDVLKGVSGAGIAGVAGMFSVSVAAAEGPEDEPITMLEKGRKMALARQLSKTEQFETLLETANERGYEFSWDLDDLDAARVEAGEFRRELVAYNFDTEGDHRAAIVIGRDLDTDEVELAQMDFEYYRSDGVLDRTERYEAATDVETTQLGRTTPDSGVRRRTIEPDPDAITAFVDRDAGTAGWTDFPDYLNISYCSGCYWATNRTCRLLCSTVGAFACGALGVTVVGAVSCVTFVKAVCYVANYTSGCGDDLGATICKHPVVDVCDDDESGDIIDVDIPYF